MRVHPIDSKSTSNWHLGHWAIHPGAKAFLVMAKPYQIAAVSSSRSVSGELVDSPFLTIANIPGQQSGYRRGRRITTHGRVSCYEQRLGEV
jgi:hypothetical protein